MTAECSLSDAEFWAQMHDLLSTGRTVAGLSPGVLAAAEQRDADLARLGGECQEANKAAAPFAPFADQPEVFFHLGDGEGVRGGRAGSFAMQRSKLTWAAYRARFCLLAGVDR